MEVIFEFTSVSPEDLWVYNKLQVAAMLNHICGPIGAPVPKCGWYIIKPIVTFLGMGRNARKIWLSPHDQTEKYGNRGEMWCEYFYGDHISVDYYKKHQILTVFGKKAENLSSCEETRWAYWKKVDQNIPLPKIFHKICDKYGTINAEYIGGNLIEVHLRKNPDFVWNNEVAIPVWEGEIINPPANYRFVESPDYQRRGFYVK